MGKVWNGKKVEWEKCGMRNLIERKGEGQEGRDSYFLKVSDPSVSFPLSPSFLSHGYGC